MLSKMDEYLFDLNGFLILKGALSAEEVAKLNGELDALPAMTKGDWYGHVHCTSFGKRDGINLQQIYEAGPTFASLVDHPSWIEHVKHFVGGQDDFDSLHGPVFIDENFASIRGPGDAIGIHSGGHLGTKRTQFRYFNGRFACGQINVLFALNDVGPGDGATMVIPASHKANLPHPEFESRTIGNQGSVDGMVGAMEVHLNAGDALLFVDALCHGSSSRVNPGERRICVYRYGPSWGFFRHGYRPSSQLLDRLSPEARQIVMPHQEVPREPQVKAEANQPVGAGA